MTNGHVLKNTAPVYFFSISVATAFVAVCSLVYSRQHRIKEKEDEEEGAPSKDPSTKTVSLLPFDELFITRGVSPVATITWFKGNYAKSAKYFENRLASMLRKNPWLQGQLVRRSTDKRHVLIYSDVKPIFDVKDMFVLLPPDQSPIHADMAMEELHDECAQAGVKVALQQFQDLHQPVLQVTVVPCRNSPSTRFAIFVSLSHAVGDGHTYYQLYHMLLQSSKEVRSLVVDRIAHTQRLQDEALGLPEARFTDSPTFASAVFKGIFQIMLGSLWGKMAVQSKARVFMIDHTKIKKIKTEAEFLDHVPFISTNDICTSWLLSQSGCPYGIMWINFRNRLEGHADHHVGNYENVLFYRNPDDVAHPGLIRQSLQNMRRAVTYDRKISTWQHIGQSCCLVTNWSSFAKLQNVEVPDSELLVSYPYFDLHQMLPTIPYGVIFEAKPTQLGIILLGPEHYWNGLKKPPFAI